ncbi:MAG: hypothetical protein AB1558_12850 [Thermodesulfobacteriota bacterium]
MKGIRSGMKQMPSLLLAAILFLPCLWLPSPGHALMALPDVGIDYHTMKVIRAEKLAEAGMTGARNGDAVSMRLSSGEGRIIFRNLRTNEEWTYPPESPKGKTK